MNENLLFPERNHPNKDGDFVKIQNDNKWSGTPVMPPDATFPKMVVNCFQILYFCRALETHSGTDVTVS